MEKLLEKEIIVTEGKRPFWHLIIASILYTATLVFLYYFFIYLYQNGDNVKGAKSIASFLKFAVFSFMGALNFSVIKTIYINQEKEKLKTQLSVGPFYLNYYSKIPVLEYVAVFKNQQKEIFEVNLWYKGNKHYKMFAFEERVPAFQLASQAAIKLNIDLLDATEKGNSKWIKKE